MRITGVYASNFLSFAPSPNAFVFDRIHDDVNIIVGPNGHGKSNVFRLIETVLDTVRSGSVSPQVLRGYAHLPSDGSEPEAEVELSLDIELNDTSELDLLTLYIQSLLINPDIQAVLPPEMSHSGQFNMKPDRYETFCRWVESCTTPEQMKAICKGRIVVKADIDDNYSGKIYYEVPDYDITFDLNQSSLTKRDSFGNRYSNLSVAFLEGQDPTTLRQLLHFLNGDNVPFPELLPFWWTDIISGAFALQRNIGMRIGANSFSLTQNRLMGCFVRLAKAMGQSARDNTDYAFVNILTQIINKSVLSVDNWTVEREELVDMNQLEDLELLRQGKLASFLFGLKNGSRNERKRFEEIQKTFKQLSGNELDVCLTRRQKSGGSINETLTYVQTVVTEQIPLNASGSGRAQLALLSTIMNLEHKVILLDEPNAFLHPSIQLKVRDKWEELNAQHIVITHSPYMVGLGNMKSLRRVYMDPISENTKVTGQLAQKDIVDAGFLKQIRQTDDTLFLFAKAVVLVEGFDEAMALPIWFDKWVREKHELTGDSVGVYFLNATGKNRIMQFASVLNKMDIPWIALYDADVLEVLRDENKNTSQIQIINSWENMGIIAPGSVVLGDASVLTRASLGDGGRIFFTGSNLKNRKKWEHISVYRSYKQEATREVGNSGPSISRYLAEKYECPNEFYALFERAYKMATNGF